jgi:thiol-disulfide isomerase/thioredoxin
MAARHRLAALVAITGLAATAVVLAADPPPAAAPAIVTPDAFRATIDAERGRTLVVNLWASWCAPCLREVPELLKLEQAWARCGLRVLGIALDEPTELATAVQPTVARYFPAFRTLARDGSSMDSFASVLDGAWNEVMPTSYIVAPDGTVAKRIQGGKTYAEFEAAVKPLLQCPAA